MIDLLNQIPPTVYVALFTASFTAIATLTGVYLTNRANNQRLKIQFDYEQSVKEREFRREKLEELYLLFKNRVYVLNKLCLLYLEAAKKSSSYWETIGIEGELTSSKNLDFNRISLIIDLYFGDIKPVYEEFLKIEERAEDFIRSSRFKALSAGRFFEYSLGDTPGDYSSKDEFIFLVKSISTEADRVFECINKKASST
ncbi:hypothetical protein H6F88_31720 [Oculatella sp. FACHB-28]|uniref:hypothetical protein n=1 Tax=Oculatella sp. FACHB-28 TaxID=2692845 RepID=UPI0016843EF2|nr:hypothetical protein [Oculatella sp. FACHB-28]MBD2060512.1 hypothetical protein [Oculatella sp. FACHB-28]